MFKKTIIRKILVSEKELIELRTWLYDCIISDKKHERQAFEIKNRYIPKDVAINNNIGCCSISNGDFLSYSDITRTLRGYTITNEEPEDLWLLNLTSTEISYINYTNDKSEFPWNLCRLFLELKGKMLVEHNSIYTVIDTSNPFSPTEMFLYDLFDNLKESGWQKIDPRPWVNNPNLQKNQFDEYDYKLLIEFKEPDMFKMKMFHVLTETKETTFRCELTVTKTVIDIVAENTFDVNFRGLISKLKVE